MEYEYDVAISFAGEDRAIAKQIAEKLKANNINVFYDEYEEANLLGEDLYERLHDVYSSKARFCIMLISKFYIDKAWTQHERKSAQERALRENKPYILPVRLDSTPVPGLRDTIGYFNLQSKSIDELVTVVLQKLHKETAINLPAKTSNKSKAFSIPLPERKISFTERDKDRFYEESFITIKEYFKQGIQQLNNTNNFEANFTEMAAQRFTCKIYSQGKRVTACTIWAGSNFSHEGSINFTYQANQDSSSSTNEILTIEVKDDKITFKALMSMFGSQKSEGLSSVEAAQYLWSKLIEPLNRPY